MNLQHRIALLSRLGQYISGADTEWQDVKDRAYRENGWFIPEFVDHAATGIADHFLKQDMLEAWVAPYRGQIAALTPKKVGIIMAGNIPLVGFHDLLCVFITGHMAVVKLSSRDQVLIKHLVSKLVEWDAAVAAQIGFAEMLKGCDAYIATGSNNSSRYFDYYFGKYPTIIRRNRTSVAVIDGTETPSQLEQLADDIHLFFGLGCRNVTKILVPANYDFVPLLDAFKKYQHFADHHKYKNNYDYNLALHLLNNRFYMTNGSILLVEERPVFSPISQLNYEFYSDDDDLSAKLPAAHELQCSVGNSHIPFGQAQHPSVTDYADDVNTLEFLLKI